MRPRRLTGIASVPPMGALLVLSALAPRAAAAAPPAHSDGVPLPEKAIVLGVPFVSFAEAARLSYSDKDVLNPSVPACYAMVFRFWGRDVKELESKEYDGNPKWAKTEHKRAESLDEVKPLVARGIPVIVSPAATPHAHYLNPAVAAMLAFEKKPSVDLKALAKKDVTTGILGRMCSFETFGRMKVKGMERPILESVYEASRVLVGYDDARQVVTLLDPSFGPGLEVSYADFDAMWEPMGRPYTALSPPDYAAPEGRPTAGPYRERTPAEKAAELFVRGYALSAIGRPADAEPVLRAALEVKDAGRGYEHLILLELACIDDRARRHEQAADEAERAAKLIPENAVAWHVVAWTYVDTKSRSGRMGEARFRAERLRSDPKNAKLVADILPHEFYIQTLASLRGWAGEKDASATP